MTVALTSFSGDGAKLTAAFPELLDDLGAKLALQPVTMIFMRIPPLLILQFAVGHILEVLAVGALAVTLGGLHELAAHDPTVLVGDLLHDRDRQALRPPLSLSPHRPNTKLAADTMPQEPAKR